MDMSTITAPAPTGLPRPAPVRRLFVAALLAVILGGAGVLAQLGCERMRRMRRRGQGGRPRGDIWFQCCERIEDRQCDLDGVGV